MITSESKECIYGPTIHRLQAYVWNIKCPPKIQHFIWQTLSGGVAVAKNLRSRGIECDLYCPRCGTDEETINHMLFECPPATQTWALSKIPSHPDIFPTSSIFSNMDYLFSRIAPDSPEGYFPWIIWYIWKSRNDKLFTNIDRNARNILLMAETEGEVWKKAQTGPSNTPSQVLGNNATLGQQGTWRCQVDGSWKERDRFSGQGWVCSRDDTENCQFGTRNIRGSQSPLHAELEALIWAMECMVAHNRRDVTFATDSTEVVKMVSSPEEWPAFLVHLEEFNLWRAQFDWVRVTFIPRAKNTKADRLARGARQTASAMVSISTTPSDWVARTA